MDWDGPILRQSERFARYHAALDQLIDAGLTYECYCSRREIREAAAAPHGPGPDGGYPGTCRDLTESERRRRRTERPPAIRLRADPSVRLRIDDLLAGPTDGTPDDLVLRRNDGVPAYHLAVVVDDAAQGVTTVVRGDDLLAVVLRAACAAAPARVCPRWPTPTFPWWSGPTGQRLAKRDGAVTRRDLAAAASAMSGSSRRWPARSGSRPDDDPTSRRAGRALRLDTVRRLWSGAGAVGATCNDRWT